MSTILVFAEQRGGVLKKPALEALSTAQRLAAESGATVAAVVVGSGIRDLAAEAARYGADTVHVADHTDLALYSSEGYAFAVQKAFEKAVPDLVLLAATAMGKDLAPRVAARLSLALLPDVIELNRSGDGVTAVRPMFAGKVLATVRPASGRTPIVSLRANVFGVGAPRDGASPAVLDLDLSGMAIRGRVTEVRQESAGKVELTEADVVVSGGRGVKGPENFPLIQDLADALNGALGASRAVVDAGWIDHAHQVGQTGKTVSPGLYVACGISGAIQHLAGMSSSKVIVAINKDPEAPIFKVADYGIVGDLFEVVPKLTAEVRRVRSQ